MIDFWNSLGTVGHVAIYAAGLSILGIIFGKMSEKTGIVGTIGKALKALVDFFSANIVHGKK